MGENRIPEKIKQSATTEVAGKAQLHAGSTRDSVMENSGASESSDDEVFVEAGHRNKKVPEPESRVRGARKGAVRSTCDTVAWLLGLYFLVHALCWPFVLLCTIAAYILSSARMGLYSSVWASALGTFLAAPLAILVVASLVTSLRACIASSKAARDPAASAAQEGNLLQCSSGPINRAAVVACMLTCVCSGLLATMLVGCRSQVPIASVALTTVAVMTAVGGLCFGMYMLSSVMFSSPSTKIEQAGVETNIPESGREFDGCCSTMAYFPVI